jgi:Domain of unknown function (DUF4249)
MKKRSVVFSFILILSMSLIRCIDPFNPKLEEFQSLLVVDAMLTDEDAPAYVRLTRTTETLDERLPMVTSASVSITDDLGNSTSLGEVAAGVYQSDILNLRGTAGREYTLRIRTKDGKEYESNSCPLNEARDIDSVYFGQSSQIADDGEEQQGIRIYIDSKDPSKHKYYRWAYEEWWKFRIPYPVTYKYIRQDSIVPIPVENLTCYKNRKSDEVLIQFSDSEVNGEFTKKPVCFIASDKSDRLLIQYCIQVSQYAISANEYEFWRLTKEIGESGGDIFDKQPFPIISNIHCVSDPGENVLGYFQVCGVRKKMIYIKGSDITAMGLQPYHYVCDMITKGPQDYLGGTMSFYDIYQYFTTLNYNFIAPLYLNPTVLDRLMFLDKNCSDCTRTGSPDKPDFWVDLE